VREQQPLPLLLLLANGVECGANGAAESVQCRRRGRYRARTTEHEVDELARERLRYVCQRHARNAATAIKGKAITGIIFSLAVFGRLQDDPEQPIYSVVRVRVPRGDGLVQEPELVKLVVRNLIEARRTQQ